MYKNRTKPHASFEIKDRIKQATSRYKRSPITWDGCAMFTQTPKKKKIVIIQNRNVKVVCRHTKEKRNVRGKRKTNTHVDRTFLNISASQILSKGSVSNMAAKKPTVNIDNKSKYRQ